ncbi:MAG: hypothetical protein NTY48_01135 [Candidatus Diapherotrites archaeon]|nr:hypothetical protein [Candidatus Diapherotrites archaeon]
MPPNMEKRKIEIHLGNVGYSRLAWQTRKMAKKNPDTHYIGIDIRRPIFVQGRWKQIKADFASGLNRLKDNSVHLIKSEMALGDFSKNGSFSNSEKIQEQTNETVKIAYEKLKTGGELRIVAEYEGLLVIKNALAQSPFLKEKIKSRTLLQSERKNTFWIWLAPFITIYEITAVK